MEGPCVVRRSVWLSVALCGVFALFAGPIIVMEVNRGRGAFDEYWFHQRVVWQFMREWLSPSFKEYASATTPGYHLAIALAGKVLGPETPVLRVAGAMFTLAMLTLLACVTTRTSIRGTSWMTGDAPAEYARPLGFLTTLVLMLPAVSSMYVLFPGAWLQPDNAAWLLVLAIVALSLRARLGVMTYVLGALLLMALVWVRQVHVWCAGPLLATAWLGRDPIGDGRIIDLLSRPASRVGRSVLMGLALAPAFASLAWFHSLWGGLTPPHFQAQYPSSVNWATPAFALSLVALYSMFFAGWLLPAARGMLSSARGCMMMGIAGLVGVALAAVPETTYLFETRSSGLWGVVARAPVIAGYTSVVLLVFAPLGAMALTAWIAPLPARPRWVLIGALTAFIVAQTATPLCWQRYHEPLALLLLPMLACAHWHLRDGTPESRMLTAARVLGPLVMAGVFWAITLGTLVSAGPVPGDDPNAAQVEAERPR